MNIEDLRTYCLSIRGSSESTPFINNRILVFKVTDKMFAYIDLEPRDGKFNVCLKCHPEKTVELREKYNGIIETSFKSLMWNAVYLESDVPDKLIEELINHSVEEVVKKLSKKKRKDMKDCTKNIKNIKASPIPDTVSLMQASGTKAEQNFTSELPNVSKNTS